MTNVSNAGEWQYSQIVKDMTSGTEEAAANIHANQVYTDSIARESLYMVPPATSYTNFNNYGTSYGITPPPTIADSLSNMGSMYNPNLMIGAGSTGFGGAGGFAGTAGSPSFAASSMGWNGTPFPPYQGTPGGSTPDDPVEAEYKEKYDELKSLVDKLNSTDSKLSKKNKKALQSAINKSGKTYEEKYNNLNQAYKSISQQDIKDAFTKSTNITVNGETMAKRMQQAGLETESSDAKGQIASMSSAIAGISNNNGKLANNMIFGSFATGAGAFDILDVISHWNSQGNAKHLMLAIGEKYNALSDTQAKNLVKTEGVQPLVNALLQKAGGLKENLDADKQVAMQNAMDKLTQELNASSLNFTALSKAFDDVYVLSRKAAIIGLRNDLKDEYGETDPNLFSDDMFEAETAADLAKEGFNQEDIDKAGTTYQASSSTNSSGSTSESDGVSLVESEQDAETVGHDVADALIGYTNDDEMAYVKKALQDAGKSNNAIGLLKGYYSNNGGGNGFFEQLATESTHFKASDVMPVLESFMEQVPPECKKMADYVKLQELVKKAKEHFQNEGPDAEFKGVNEWGWGWNRTFGNDLWDDVDDKVENILDKIKSNSAAATNTQ